MAQDPKTSNHLTCCAALGGFDNSIQHSSRASGSNDENPMGALEDFAIPLQDEREDCNFNIPSQAVTKGREEAMTQLFSAIEGEKWEEAILFLETGSFFGWGESSLSLFNCGETPVEDPQSQVRTWVVAKDWWGSVTSKRLPMHAAVMKGAPLSLIQKLIEMYPDSIRCKDMDGNLPLHLSFKHDSPDGVVAFLLKSYPEAVGEKNKSGCQPVDYASADACEIIQVCVEQTNKVAQREEERLCQALELEKTRLTEILSQLSEIRGELDHLRKSKTKSPGQLESGEPQEEHLKHDPSLQPVTPKKQKSDRKLRFPWMRKKVGAA